MRLEAVAPSAVADGTQGQLALGAVVGSPRLHAMLHEAIPAAALRSLAVPSLGILNGKVWCSSIAGWVGRIRGKAFGDTRGYFLVTQLVSQQRVSQFI